MRSRERGGDSTGSGPNAKGERGVAPIGGGSNGDGTGATMSVLPTKLYFRINEVTNTINVETHMLHY